MRIILVKGANIKAVYNHARTGLLFTSEYDKDDTEGYLIRNWNIGNGD